MKRTLHIGLLITATLVSTYSFAQETTLASAAPATTATTTAPATTEGEEKKEEAPKFTLSGSIDTYARTSLGVTTIAGEDEFGDPIFSSGPNTSFANLKGFGLGMANIIASYSGEKAGFTADLVFGPRGQAAVFGTASGQAVINQMFAFYKISDKVTFNLGQFNTFLGYEVISPAVNFHYSTSYLFSWGPFNHTGFRADFALENGVVFKAAIMNPTDIVEFNPVDTYTLGGQVGYANDKGGVWLNLLYGDQDGTLEKVGGDESAGSLFQVDVTTGWNLGEKFYLGFNTSMQSVAAGEVYNEDDVIVDAEGDASSFFGVAVYPKLTLSDAFALGLRAEYFSIKNGHLGIIALDDEGDGSVTAFTLSGNYKTGGLTIIPEVRLDSSKDSFFKDSDLEKVENSMISLTLAAVYKF
jgi:hypothetical protein